MYQHMNDEPKVTKQDTKFIDVYLGRAACEETSSFYRCAVMPNAETNSLPPVPPFLVAQMNLSLRK